VRHESAGLIYEQTPYRYQVKFLRELRKAFSNLSENGRIELKPLLADTGCLPHLSGDV
jgi:hypothetical protein